MNDKPKSDILKHPVFLILISALLSYFIIPAINKISEKNKLINDEKLKLADQIIDHHLVVDKNLNSLYVALDLFYKDHRYISNLPALNELRLKKHPEIQNLYLSFDANAWFWESHYILKAESLELIKDDIDSLRILFRSYKQALVKSSKLIDAVWESTLRNTKPFANDLNVLISSKKDSLDLLSANRNNYVKNIVLLLTAHD